MQQQYVKPWYAPTMAYDALLQRAVLAVPDGSTLAVTIDNISGKTPHRNEYKDLLQEHHASLKARGSKLQRRISFACLEAPARFVFSEHSELVQAADFVSYNVHRQFRDHGEEWEKLPGPQGGALPMYGPFEQLAEKFRTDGSGRVQGYGIVKVPLLKQVRWVVEK